MFKIFMMLAVGAAVVALSACAHKDQGSSGTYSSTNRTAASSSYSK